MFQFRFSLLLLVVLLQACGQGQVEHDATTQSADADQPPRMELLGDSEFTLQQGQSFEDPGARVLDAEDGDDQLDYTVLGSVNVEQPGLYILRYVAVDSSGNMSEPVTRVIRVEIVNEETQPLTSAPDESITDNSVPTTAPTGNNEAGSSESTEQSAESTQSSQETASGGETAAQQASAETQNEQTSQSNTTAQESQTSTAANQSGDATSTETSTSGDSVTTDTTNNSGSTVSNETTASSSETSTSTPTEVSSTTETTQIQTETSSTTASSGGGESITSDNTTADNSTTGTTESVATNGGTVDNTSTTSSSDQQSTVDTGSSNTSTTDSAITATSSADNTITDSTSTPSGSDQQSTADSGSSSTGTSDTATTDSTQQTSTDNAGTSTNIGNDTTVADTSTSDSTTSDNTQQTGSSDTGTSSRSATQSITLTTPADYVGHGPATTAEYNYGQALQMAWYFYEAQRSGSLPKKDGDLPFFDPRTGTQLHNGFFANRIPWRGDSDLEDGADVGVDLTGGWHDAGDHVKFGLPMAFSASVLAWGVLEFGDALLATDQMKWAKDNLRWVADYFIKAHVSPNELYGQVGAGAVDHTIWGAPEVMPHIRPAWKIDLQNPGPDLAFQTAAAMTTISLVFRDEEPLYADVLLQHAKELYEFGMATLGPAPNLGHYSDSITDAQNFYASRSGAKDDLPFAAAWLYKATKEPKYLHDAEAYYTPIADNTGHKGWTLVWDDVRYGVYMLMAQIYSDPDYQRDSLIGSERNNGYYDYNLHAQNFLNHWLRDGGMFRTPGGMAWLAPWASARYNTATAFLAMVYRKHLQQLNVGQQLQDNYLKFATEQVNYVLGDNPLGMSYMVGYGDNYSQVAHHRASHGSTINAVSNPAIPRHVLYGALAGGPRKDDSYTGDRSAFAMTEVATDMNAGLNGLLAALVSAYGIEGNQTDPDFPLPGPVYDEIYIKAKLQTKQISELGTGVLVTIVNESAYPPRHSDKYRFRYFVDLSEIFNAGYTLDDVILDVYWDEAGGGVSFQRWQDSAYIFYVEGRFDGTFVTPLGKDKKLKNIEFLLRLPWVDRGWNPTNDPSYQDLVPNVAVMTDKIALYDMNQPEGQQLIWGTEPNPGISQSEAPPPGTVSPEFQAASATFDIQPFMKDTWATGSCVDFIITNTSEVAGSPAGFQFVLPANVSITNSWNGELTRDGDIVDVRLQNLGTIAPGASNNKFGYCADANVVPQMEVTQSTASPSGPDFQFSVAVRDKSADGYCADFSAKNVGDADGAPTLLEFAMASEQQISSSSGGQPSQSGHIVSMQLLSAPTVAVNFSAQVATVCVINGIVEPSFERDSNGALVEPISNSFLATLDAYTVWDGGYCVDFYLANTGSEAATPLYLAFELNPATTISNSWNGTVSRDGSQVMVTLPTSVKQLMPSESRKDFGFCAAGNDSPYAVIAR